MQELLARGVAAAGPPKAALTAAEAERIVSQLKPFGIEEYGTAAWFDQQEHVEQLNLQAHLNAQTHSDEFVKEALVSLDRVAVLVHELLVAEVWREKLLPLLEQHLAEHVDSVTAYQLVFHEGALANLLEVLLYHPDACECMGEEALIELCDWCSRCIHYLATDAHKHVQWKELSPKDAQQQGPVDELRQRVAEVRFGAAQCGLSILRYITDHAQRLSLSVLARIVSTNDTVMTLLPLLEHPPWVRRGKSGVVEKFVGGAWQAVEMQERYRLAQQDGQVWLLLYNLLVDGASRSKMDMSEARCDTLLKLRRHFNELLMDQLPVLRGLRRVLDELAFGVNSAQAMATPSRLIVEQVPTMRSSLLRRGGWKELAEQQAERQFGAAAAAQLSQARLQSMMRRFDLLCDMEEDGERQREAGKRQPPTAVKVDAYRRVKEGVWEWWSTYNLQINTDKEPEAVSAAASAAAPKENQPQQASTADGAAPAPAAKGKRYRLLPLSESLQRALPADGKITVLYGGHQCEAQLSLPASETKDTSGLASGVWLTVGGMYSSGLALQLKLKRLDKPSERDKELGLWYPYVPVGGALAVRDGLLEAGGN